MDFATLEQVGDFLGAPEADLRRLHRLWQRRQPIEKATPPAADAPAEPALDWLRHDAGWVRRFAAHALAAGDFLLACDAAQEGLRLEPGATDAAERRAFALLRCDYATALARLGSANRAQAELERVLQAEGAAGLEPDERAAIWTQLGHVRSEAAHEEPTDPEWEAGCISALEAFRQALVLRPGALEATIQSAILRLHLRQPAAARAGAEETLRAIEHGVPESEMGALGARAAALALLGRGEEACAAYHALAAAPQAGTWELAKARHRARLLAPACGLERMSFDGCFPPLELLVFSGHMPDAPDRPVARFPNTAESIAGARAAIARRLRDLKAFVGFSAAAAGGDLLFLEELLRRGGTAHVVLPWSREQFLQESVQPYGVEWVERFHAVLDQAASVREMGEAHRLTDPIGLEYQAEVTAGLARMIAHASRLDLQPLALWDGGLGRPGGTGAFVALWRDELQVRVETIAPAAEPAAHAPAAAPVRTRRVEEPIVSQHVETILFADIVGYSKLREQVIPLFVTEFMGRVAEAVAASPHAPMNVNTWGDGLYFVFDRVADGGRFALELLRMVAAQAGHWERLGLGSVEGGVFRPLSVRIALHAGPVYLHFDPVARRLSFTGAHVSRAARIEPITEAGGVYASEEFAALAAVTRAEGFRCEFVGTRSLAKGYPGPHRLYRLVPVHLLPLERLARLIHRRYVEAMRARGATMLAVAWEDLPPERQAANRAQAADLDNKLRALGYELTESAGMRAEEIPLPPVQLETLARAEHQRWMDERLSHGWTHAPVRDDRTRRHPLLVPWEALDEVEREKDRDAIRNVPLLVAEAGLRVRRLARE
jgi:hypothetical protein